MECGSRIRVLHVDNDATFLDATKKSLDLEKQIIVDNVSSVDAALTKIKNSPYDVIVSDYAMPEKTGLDLLKTLRENGSELPFILFTDKEQEETAVYALNLGANRYITKQNSPETDCTELISCIHQLYKNAQTHPTQGNNNELDQALAKSEVLIEKLNVVGGFVRHDIRNKLSIVNCALFLAKKNVCPNSQMDVYYQQICCAVKNIVHLLDFAQTYETAGTHGLVWVPLGKAVDDAIALSASLKRINVEIKDFDFEVLADNAIVEIFHNFIDNSLKYGQNLTEIKIHTKQNATGSLSIIYEDNGGGIDPDIKRRLFQKEAGRGTGLGLYLIQRICKVYDWDVQENGDSGKGVRFVITVAANQFRPCAVTDYDEF
jgi:signal transduction histidine kinase